MLDIHIIIISRPKNTTLMNRNSYRGAESVLCFQQMKDTAARYKTTGNMRKGVMRGSDSNNKELVM